MKGAYYRADVTSQISVLALNTLYWNEQDDLMDEGTTPHDQLNWFESQLANAEEGRKFIPVFHIYPGAKHTKHYKIELKPEYNEKYIRILNKYADKIIIEVGAHDHYGDFRYHDLDISDVNFAGDYVIAADAQEATYGKDK